jgi:alpha/beta superfamily hydrolase
MKADHVTIPCGNISLEGVWETPNGGKDHLPAAIICHNHPLYGGDMNNTVVAAVAQGLLSKGFACLRFNFRGVGRSQGQYGRAMDELDDVHAALDFVAGRDEIDSSGILVSGFSFGCWVGLQAACRDDRPSRLVGISPPVNGHDLSFLQNEKRPVLLIAGELDHQYCAKDKFEELVGSIPEPKKGITIANSDHFHTGKEDALVEEIATFLEQF